MQDAFRGWQFASHGKPSKDRAERLASAWSRFVAKRKHWAAVLSVRHTPLFTHIEAPR